MAEMRTALGVPVTHDTGQKGSALSAWFKEVWDGFTTTLVGMGVTWRHFFRKPITVQYPHEHVEIPPRSRQRIHVDIDLCNGCMQCERICPASVIHLVTAKPLATEDVPLRPNGKKRALHVPEFTLDHSKCLYCGLCQTVCNDDAIYTITDYHFTTNDRSSLFVNYGRYTAEQRDQMVAAAAAEKAAKAAAPKPPPPAAAAPAPAPKPAEPLDEKCPGPDGGDA